MPQQPEPSRLQRSQADLAAKGWDALLVCYPDDVRYLTGARGTLTHLLVSPCEAVLLAHFVDLEQSRLEAPWLPVQRMEWGGKNEVAAIVQDWRAKTVALGRAHPRIPNDAMRDHLRGLDMTVVSDDGLVPRMRRYKDDGEIALIRKATEINDAAMAHIIPMLKPGVTEREMAIETRHVMWQAGVEDIRFLAIQFGPHSALPHYYPTGRRLERGDFVLLDWVPVYDGYASDVTRTFVVGEPSKKQREIYDLVLRAQLAGLAAAKPGVTGRQADAAARQIIAEGGYGAEFGHTLGHGINEGPTLGPDSDDVLEPGMGATVEPGIYIPGFGGVRIEDTVVVTPDGAQPLPTTTKELTILG